MACQPLKFDWFFYPIYTIQPVVSGTLNPTQSVSCQTGLTTG